MAEVNVQQMLVMTNKLIELYQRGDTWCQGTLARDANGNPCGTVQRGVNQWCLVGALTTFPVEATKQFADLFRNLILSGGNISDWNDAAARKIEDVVQALMKFRTHLNTMASNPNN